MLNEEAANVLPQRSPASFHSILFDEPESDAGIATREAPEFFKDLNLDQIVASITAGRDEYNLIPFFYCPLTRVEAVNYRYDALRDLGDHALPGYIRSFAKQMREVRSYIAQADKPRYQYQKENWFPEAVDTYCGAVKRLTEDLVATDLHSRAFLAFREFLTSYTQSSDFTSLAEDTHTLKTDLSGVRYSLYLAGPRITVARYEPEPDYGADVLQTFARFKQRATEEYRFDFAAGSQMNHVEAAILDLVARLYPEIFSSLDEYCSRHAGFLNSTIARFDHEVQFYIACLDHVEGFKRSGLHFCYPDISDRSKEVFGRDVFDLALADKLLRERSTVVTNEFHLSDPERIFVVTGPNQGGKTTFARTFGQMHYLASIGCPVPGSAAKLFLFDTLFTHFDRVEDIRNLSSKLEHDLLRIHRILESATSRDILIMNESLLSTTLSDALFLSKQIMQQIIERDMLCVSVTFLDELSSMSETTVSMVSTVNPGDPAQRTFKVVRRPADGLAYAVAIAEKYHLTFNSVKDRIAGKVKESSAS